MYIIRLEVLIRLLGCFVLLIKMCAADLECRDITSLDVMIVIDITESMAHYIDTVKSILPKIIHRLQNTYQDSRFGLVPFNFKPYVCDSLRLQNRNYTPSQNFCAKVHKSLTGSDTQIKKALDSLTIEGGSYSGLQDAFGAMAFAALTPYAYWRDIRKTHILRIMVVITDSMYALPRTHFKCFPNTQYLNENNGDDYYDCKNEDFPSKEQVVEALKKQRIRPLFLVTDKIFDHYRKLSDSLELFSGAKLLRSAEPSNFSELLEKAVKELSCMSSTTTTRIPRTTKTIETPETTESIETSRTTTAIETPKTTKNNTITEKTRIITANETEKDRTTRGEKGTKTRKPKPPTSKTISESTKKSEKKTKKPKPPTRTTISESTKKFEKKTKKPKPPTRTAISESTKKSEKKTRNPKPPTRTAISESTKKSEKKTRNPKPPTRTAISESTKKSEEKTRNPKPLTRTTISESTKKSEKKTVKPKPLTRTTISESTEKSERKTKTTSTTTSVVLQSTTFPKKTIVFSRQTYFSTTTTCAQYDCTTTLQEAGSNVSLIVGATIGALGLAVSLLYGAYLYRRRISYNQLSGAVFETTWADDLDTEYTRETIVQLDPFEYGH